MNLIAQKILLCLASNIEPKDKDFKTYTFSVKKFHDLFGLNGATKYTELSKITKNLLSKIIEIRNGEELIQVSWLSSAVYNKTKGTINMRFDPILKRILIELNNKFTSYRLGNIIKLRSTYSIRIYELLKQYEDIKSRTISLQNLRYYLDATNIYPNYRDFKQRVLKPVQNELNKDITFHFEEIKSGKNFSKIKFHIQGKIITSSDKHNKTTEFYRKINNFELKHQQKIPNTILKKWGKTSDKVLKIKIIENIHYRTNIEYPIAYVEHMLNNNLEKNTRPIIQIFKKRYPMS